MIINNKLFLKNGSKTTELLDYNLVLTLARNISSLGFLLSPEVLSKLLTYTEDELTKFHSQLVAELKELKGVRNYRPMYPNFPKQVIEASDTTLFVNAILHYYSSSFVDVFGANAWLPNYVKDERLPLTDKTEYILLGLIEDADAELELLAKGALTPKNRDEVKFLVENGAGFSKDFRIANKETLVFFTQLLFDKGMTDEVSMNWVKSNFTNVTEVLRLACSMSGGDVSLATVTKFRNFTRKERKFLVSLIANCPNLEEDLKRWKNRWIRLAHSLHVGDFNYPNVTAAFRKLRNGEYIPTFNGKVENGLLSKRADISVELLKQRPTEFARRLNHILSFANISEAVNIVLPAFKSVTDKVSTKVLLELSSFYRNRNVSKTRMVFPKGNTAKFQVLDTPLKEIAPIICGAVGLIVQDALVKKFSTLEPLGKVYVAPELENYFVPFAERSASKALKTVTRGSKIPFGDKNIQRFFIWWKDGDYRTDIDLSATFFTEDFKNRGSVSYMQLRSEGATHSGDITSAPNGACEFVDLNVEKLLARGVRYVSVSINSFTQQPYKDLPECFAGWMPRESGQRGEIYEPRTVENKIDLASDSTMVTLLVVDLKERNAIWCDLSNRINRGRVNNVSGNARTIETLLKGIVDLQKPNLHYLFSIHAKARGELVNNPNEADVVFGKEWAYENVNDFLAV